MCARERIRRRCEAKLQGELHGWLASHLADMSPQEKAVWQKQSLRLSPGGAGFSGMRRDYGEGLLLLMVAACCVLLVACANIANLLLARGLRNRQQTAVRVALGASRGRLVRNALLESVALSLIGGAAGVAVAWAGARLILYLAFHCDGTKHLDSGAGFALGAGSAFRAGVSVLTGVIFGIVPAWMTSHADPVEALRGANRAVGGGRHWAQKALVIVQAAISLVLLSAAAMLGRACAISSTRISASKRMAATWSPSIPCCRTTSRNNWTRSSARFRTGSAPFPACAASRRRPTRR